MKVDYIVVGCGLAGIAFCEQLRHQRKTFIFYDDASQQSSKVAGGLFNPVVLKRFTMAWKANLLLDKVLPFYRGIEKYLDVNIVHETSIFRKFNSIEEQNNWFAASDNPMLSEFLLPEIEQNKNPNVNAEFGLGKVLKTGRIDTRKLITSYFDKLQAEDILKSESFNYNALIIHDENLHYKGVQAEHIVFSDGFGMKNNAYFDYLPLIGSKGEYIIIKAPELKLDFILKGSVFIIPLENENYMVGATYDNSDKSNTPTLEKKQELISKLEKMINCEFDVIDHIAGIRPTVKDRRPLVGCHPKYKSLSVLNGLGTRGVMASPYIAKQLFDRIENGIELDPEINIQRYENLFIG